MRKIVRLTAYVLSCTLTLTGCGVRLKRNDKEVNIKDIVISFEQLDDKVNDNTESLEKEEITQSPTETVVPEKEEIPTKTVVPETEEIPTETIAPETEDTTETIIPDNDEVNKIIHNMAYVTDDLNVRTSNTTNALVIGSLDVHDVTYRILSCDNNWDLVKSGDLIGYVCSDYLNYSAGEYKDSYEHLEYKDVVLTTSELNFRTGPGTEYDKIQLFPKDTELKVSAKTNNGWLLVEYNGMFGYVHGDYVSSLLEKANTQYPNLGLTELDFTKIVYSTTTLNFRNGNSTDYDKLSQFEKYETVRVLFEVDGWYFVMTNDYNFGFIAVDYTKELTDTFIVVDKSEQQLYMYNNDELLYTTPVTTGKDSTPSDTGLFEVFRMARDTYLTGADYREFVEFWIQYNGGEGIHDARWRYVYGTEDYHTKGSHGCINTPRETVSKIYQLTQIGTDVIVHK